MSETTSAPVVLREFREPHIQALLEWHAMAPDQVKHDAAIRCGVGAHRWRDEPPMPNTFARRWCHICGMVQEIIP